MNKTFLKWLGLAEAKDQIKKTLVFQLFWGEEDELIEQAAILVQQRKFTEVMRIGLKVIPALMRGDLEPLFQAFPWVRADFMAYMQELQPQPALVKSSGASPEVEKYLREILDKLDKPALQPIEGNSSGPKQLGVPQFTAPTFDDDDDLELTIGKDTRKVDVASNFLNSIAKLQ